MMSFAANVGLPAGMTKSGCTTCSATAISVPPVVADHDPTRTTGTPWLTLQCAAVRTHVGLIRAPVHPLGVITTVQGNVPTGVSLPPANAPAPACRRPPP